MPAFIGYTPQAIYEGKSYTNMPLRMCVFDIIGGSNPDPILYTEDISNFRMNTCLIGLNYGMVYYAFIGTTIMGLQEY